MCIIQSNKLCPLHTYLENDGTVPLDLVCRRLGTGSIVQKCLYYTVCTAKYSYMFNTDIHTSTAANSSCSLTNWSIVRTCQR